MCRIPNPYYEVLASLVFRSRYLLEPLLPRLQYAREFRRWQAYPRRSPRCSYGGPEKLTIILLSFNRLRNMEGLVSNALHTTFVEKVIVFNNHPGHRIGDWVRVRDPRLVLLNQPKRTSPMIRFLLARNEPGPYFLAIDDDFLLYPAQMLALFEHLVADPTVPHGIQGEMFVPDAEFPWELNWRGTRRVDGLNCVFAFHQDHVVEMERLAALLGIDLAAIENGEDLVLSASGAQPPRIHEMTAVLECLSSHREGVATWRTRDDFFEERTRLFEALRLVKPMAIADEVPNAISR